MRLVSALRLLLDVYGALFLGMLLVAVSVYGVLPYEGLMRLGALYFYALCGAAFVVWAWLAARLLAANPVRPNHPGAPR